VTDDDDDGGYTSSMKILYIVLVAVIWLGLVGWGLYQMISLMSIH
jgi:hypothetical protein